MLMLTVCIFAIFIIEIEAVTVIDNENKIFLNRFGYIKNFSMKKVGRRLSTNNSFQFNLDTRDGTRSKRGVLNLYNMVSCATRCNPLSYKGYGCFCGFLGSGTPVDGIDTCCKLHDLCYVDAECPMYLEYFVPYYWRCWNNKPICAFNQGPFENSSPCAERLCECDRALSECFSHFACPSIQPICESSPLRVLKKALMIFL
ncbi:hypothetical protein GWI33_004347 [Rhynchophorus ferrugineus]|uniref:Phospholipase A2 n=1 Tax=Rhynchophorus ferrugineus TaxID=354439 RepID=A0A834MP50_RHYFE|nr:hypothetical protein GWI33_004347 [Rhynchophorus ferrugineus]